MSETGHEEKAAREPAPVVACELCRQEIPRSVATSFEGADYTRYFCGTGCLGEWQAKAQSR